MLSVLDLLDRELKQVKRDYIHSDFQKQFYIKKV